MKLLIFASISSLETLVQLEVLQSRNLNKRYIWPQMNPILYLKSGSHFLKEMRFCFI